MLLGAGLPVGPGHFDFGAFMEMRRGQLFSELSPSLLAAAHKSGWTDNLAMMVLARRYEASSRMALWKRRFQIMAEVY